MLYTIWVNIRHNSIVDQLQAIICIDQSPLGHLSRYNAVAAEGGLY
jgi:hypothetical protein